MHEMIFSTHKNLPVLNIPQYIHEIPCSKRDIGLTVKTRHSVITLCTTEYRSNAEFSFVTFTGEGNEVMLFVGEQSAMLGRGFRQVDQK